MLLEKIKLISSNKIMLYLFSRYITYSIQFISSILIAVNFGPYYFGVWSFILLVINYISSINFGISSSVNILIIQNRANNEYIQTVVASSLAMLCILAILILMGAGYYAVFGLAVFDKYEIGGYFYIICIVGIIFHFNSLFGTIYRVKNKLFEIAFFQSIIPVLVLLSLFLATGSELLHLLMGMYLMGGLAASTIFIVNKKIPWGGKPNLKISILILNKGLYLFIYNMSFLFIILSTRTLVSVFYDVKEFGYFSFSYTLANSILLFLEALAIIILPKLINKFHSNNRDNIRNLLNTLNANYVTLSYGLMFLALIIFPVVVNIIPKYQGALRGVNLISITALLYVNSFGYVSHLMAQNQEKRLSFISIFSLFVNIVLGLFLVLVLKINYDYVIIATLVSYLFFSFLCTESSRKKLGENIEFKAILFDFFPVRLLVPYLISIGAIILNSEYLMAAPLLVYCILNRNEIRLIFATIRKFIFKPNIIDIN